VDEPARIIGTPGQGDAPMEALTIELFERLNDEYADHPLVPEPFVYTADAWIERAQRRLGQVHRSIGLADLKVMELGCNTGHEVWYLSHVFGCDAWGVDITERASWTTFTDDRTHFVKADLAQEDPFEPNSFDRVISFAVFEHVQRPYELLEALYRILRPGGMAWIHANLHRGPTASHRYRQVYFPWPHLLFGDDVFREYYRRRGMPEKPAAWVNRLTWEQYEAHMRRTGFRIRALNFRNRPLDESFYLRFEWILGRYPRSDLERDFFTVVLEKPA
jgi:SAM-dependent methyltransferase